MTSIHHNTSANMALDPVPAVLLHGFNVGFIVIGPYLLILAFLVILNALCVYLIASASSLGRYEIDEIKTFSKTFLESPKIKRACGEGGMPLAAVWGSGLGSVQFILILFLILQKDTPASWSLVGLACATGVWVAGVALGFSLLVFVVCAVNRMVVGLDHMLDRYRINEGEA
jgi:hypothetical protein